MIELIGRSAGRPGLLYTLIILVFLVIVGGALYLTPRIAAMLDKKKSEGKNKGFYDGMLTEDPNAPAQDGETEEKE